MRAHTEEICDLLKRAMYPCLKLVLVLVAVVSCIPKRAGPRRTFEIERDSSYQSATTDFEELLEGSFPDSKLGVTANILDR